MKLSNRKNQALIIGIICITIPVVFSLYFSAKQSLKATYNTLTSYAQDVVFRGDKTADQISNAIKKLRASSNNEPCSANNMDMMRTIDLNSSNIQAIGYISNNILLCSSLSTFDLQWDLGPVDLVTSNRVALRFNVRIPNSHTSFIAIEKNHFVAIIHKSTIIDTALFDDKASLAAFTLDKLQIGTFRGFINPQWAKKLSNQEAVMFLQDGYAVSIIKSKKYLFAAIVALPFTYLNQTTLSTAFILVPVAGISGLLFAIMISYWARLQLSASKIIKNGIKRKEFYLVYQPVFDVSTNHCIGAEALMRWKRESGEIITPEIFIPLAEKVGVIKSLTKYAIDMIARDLQGFFKTYPDFHIAINVSAEDLQSRRIVTNLKSLIHKTQAQPSNFIIEATEHKLMNIHIVNPILKSIRKHGIKVAIDDFGTGYSNLSYLEALELDYLKIDKSFVNAVGTGASTSQVILHIIQMAKALNLQIIAEGVETQEQVEFILKQGVQFAQGSYYGKPLFLKKIIRLLKR